MTTIWPISANRFKHALIQDAAYENLLKSRRQVLHRRIGETLRDNLAATAAAAPELLAHHFTQAGLTEVAIEWWGKAGQRSLERSALVEAIEQFTRALAQIANLPATSALRREEIKLQVALLTPLVHVKGYAAPETKAAIERARLLIEQADARGEPPEDPLLLFSVLYGFWTANLVAFDGDAMRELAAQFLTLAERKGAKVPIIFAHRVMGTSLAYTGDLADGRAHYDQAVALYDPVVHRQQAARFGQDAGVSVLSYRARALWVLGYPATALADVRHALKDAREIGQATGLMIALAYASRLHIHCGNYPAANALADELVVMADEKGSLFWKMQAILNQGCSLALSGKASEAAQVIPSAINAYQSTGATLFAPWHLSNLASAYASLGQFDDAWRCIGEAMTAAETSKEKWCDAEIDRTAGEIALKLPQADAVKAEAYFERALAIAQAQQAKSWELRAATSMARLWRDQGKREEAQTLLAPVYTWFTEGFDMLDLKEANALLGELHA